MSTTIHIDLYTYRLCVRTRLSSQFRDTIRMWGAKVGKTPKTKGIWLPVERAQDVRNLISTLYPNARVTVHDYKSYWERQAGFEAALTKE